MTVVEKAGPQLPAVQKARPRINRARAFAAVDGKNVGLTFSLLVLLFLLWGFCSGLIDILNRHFQDSLRITTAQSGLVQFANYIAYFLMAIPAALLARKFGYKSGIITGLGLIAAGALWFIPATHIGSYWAFLTGLFIVAAGMACLETIANPYTTLLGATDTGALRINVAQTVNGVGRILGPIIGGQFFFPSVSGGPAGATPDTGIYIPYLGVGIMATALIVVFTVARVPDLRDGEETPSGTAGRTRKSLGRQRHFTLGVVAQFLYLAAQTGIFSFFVNYVLENEPNVTKTQASTWLGAIGLGLFMFGRFCGSALITRLKPANMLALFALINVGLTAVAIHGGKPGLTALFGTFFFMSVMFPTIFALSIRGLGADTKLGSSLVVMSMIGGGIAPLLMGHIADRHSLRASLVVPLVCFVAIALYGAAWRRLEAWDNAA
jgi:FHS family L-fucose permease-like MFS transporter